MLNLKHLYYFHVFSQELSTTKASKRLLISAPALSNQLKQLEDFLGTPLTRRISGKVVITEAGKIVLNYTQQMFSLYEGLKEKVALFRKDKKSKFRVGISQNLGVRFSFDLLCLIDKNNLTHSDSVEISFDSADEIVVGFLQGRFDLILGAFSPAGIEESTLVSQLLAFPVKLFALHKLFADFRPDTLRSESDLGEIIEAANAKGIAMILPAFPSVLREEVDLALAKAGVNPKRTIECNSSGGIIQLIEQGFGYALVPAPSLLDFKSAKMLHVLGPVEGFWQHQISAYMPKSTELSNKPRLSLDAFFLAPHNFN